MLTLTNIDVLIWVGLTTLVGGFVGSYGASYLKKKGENLATREDIDKLLEQVKAVTQATKEIEARISSQVWERQRRWEIKKDAILEAMRALGMINDAVTKLNSAFKAARLSPNPGDLSWQRHKAEATVVFNQASSGFERAMVVASLVCEQEVRKGLGAVSLAIRRIAQGIFQDNAEIYDQSLPGLIKEQALLNGAVRKELGVDEIT